MSSRSEENMRWAIERDIFITVAHITDILNVEADQESRKLELTIRSYINYMNLSLVIFKNIEICLRPE